TYTPNGSSRDQFLNEQFRQFFGERGFDNGPQKGSGSGVIISNDGYILTNNHVIQDADELEVILNDKKSYKAKLIGTDPNTDIALLKINEDNLPFVSYGNSDDVKVGEWVLAVGNPFNLTSTVTAGIVSAKGRNINIIGSNSNQQKINPVESFIQTDAAVNPGNSGGALVNTRGELIGINTAIASQTGSYSGYSFAVPVNIAKKVTDDLLKFGVVQRAFLGVSIADIDAELAKEKGISNIEGVYIERVEEGGSADGAGIKAGDIITKINDVTVNSPAELQEQIVKFRPGNEIGVNLVRDGKTKELKVVLKNGDKNTSAVKKGEVVSLAALGGKLETISSTVAAKLKIQGGVKVTELKAGKLAATGVREGFIITKIDNQVVKNKEQLQEIIESKNDNMVSLEGIYPENSYSRYIYSFNMK
ncbi:MAG: Do family serine endopeptidase, partial [Ignavibacteria bacterium]|nr:Do family serine endopeptidase [Ignavibacteria bacterium]